MRRSGLSLSLVLVSLALSACGAGVMSPASSGSGPIEALRSAQGARTVQTEIGPITLGLLPKSNQARASAVEPSYEASEGLTGLSIMGQTLPPAVDLRPFCTPVRNQGNLGSCSAFAMTGIMEAMMNVQGRGAELRKIGHLSPLFFYYAERKRMEAAGTIPQATKKDTGAYLETAAASAVKDGAPPEATVPYLDGRPALAYHASDADYQAAAPYRSGKASRATTIQGLKTALMKKHPILIGIPVYPSFMTRTVARTGEMPMPFRGEEPAGGHAVAMVGYDDAKEAFLVRNSWGTDWAQKGYFWMPYAFFKPTHAGYYNYLSCYVLD
jgi:hypothetical protein